MRKHKWPVLITCVAIFAFCVGYSDSITRRIETFSPATDAMVERTCVKIDELCQQYVLPQKVVAIQPKCWEIDENGDLTQSVPAKPGMTVWVITNQKPVAYSVSKVSDFRVFSTHVSFRPEECYASFEAANKICELLSQ